MGEEFNLRVLPSNQFAQFPIIGSSEFVVGIHADITLLTASDEWDEEEDARDFECTTQERFLYDKDLKLGREVLLNDYRICKAVLVNALTEMEALPEKYYDEIVVEVLKFVNDDAERFNQCGAVSVDIEIVKYAEFDDDDDGDGDGDDGGGDNGDENVGGIEASFAEVLADERMSEREQCVICLSGFSVGVRLLKLNCHHVFHRKCLHTWLDRSISCPLCRSQPPNYIS